MTIVWGFGVAKPVTGLQPQTVGAEEDTEGVSTNVLSWTVSTQSARSRVHSSSM